MKLTGSAAAPVVRRTRGDEREQIVESGKAKRLFRADIQSLRGIAVIFVVLYHAGLEYVPAGYLGVDIFFVISGFIITSIILRSINDKSFSFIDFYYKRSKRILPASYVVLIITIVVSPYFISDLEWNAFREQVIGAVTFTSNIVLWSQSGYFDGAAEGKPLLHYWSLAIEEQYYIILPFLLFFVRGRMRLFAAALVALASFVLALAWATTNPSAAFFLLPTRAWELGLGTIGALLPARYHGSPAFALARIPAIVVLFAVPMVPTGLPHPGLDAMLVCLATLVIIVGHNGSRLETAAPVRGLALVGDISYSLYLLHWPVLVFIRAAWIGSPPAWALWAGVALSLASSVLLYRYVEEPFRRGFLQFNRKLASGLFVGALALGVAPFAVSALHAPGLDYDHMRRTNYGLHFKCAFKEGNFEPGLPECRSSPQPSVLLWGDSYAMALAAGLGEQLGSVGLEQATSGACGPSLGVVPFSASPNSPYNREFAEDCMTFNRKVIDYIRGNDDIEVVAISSPFTSPVNSSGRMLIDTDGELREVSNSIEAATEGIIRLVEAVRASGKRILIIAPPPYGGFDVGTCLERRHRGQFIFGDHPDCLIVQADYERVRSRTIAFLDGIEKLGVPIFWPSVVLCDGASCLTEIGGVPLYRDAGHLSYDGSAAFARISGLGGRVTNDAR